MVGVGTVADLIMYEYYDSLQVMMYPSVIAVHISTVCYISDPVNITSIVPSHQNTISPFKTNTAEIDHLFVHNPSDSEMPCTIHTVHSATVIIGMWIFSCSKGATNASMTSPVDCHEVIIDMLIGCRKDDGGWTMDGADQ